MRDSRRGAQFFSAAAVDDPGKVNRGSGREHIAHNRNLALVLVPDGAAKWSFLVPSFIGVDAAGAASPLSLGWKKGVLRVEAGGKTFDAEFTRDGRYTFRHGGP
jgi:hypothetical protein